LASFANPESKMCEACKVAGCHRCGAKRNICATCQDGFALHGEACLSKTRHYWNFCFTILGFVGIFVVYYLFVLFFLREVKNPEALKAGLEFRELSSTRNVAKDKPYSLWSNLQTRVINGTGIMLHFRWQGFVLAWAIFGTVLFAIAGILFWERLGVMHRPNARKSYDACEENVAATVADFNAMEAVYFICVMIIYLVTFLGSLWFAYTQRKFYHMQDHDNTTMKDFALFASGFPFLSGREKVEEQRLKWFKEQPQFKGLDVVGVSICWNYRDKIEDVDEQIRREFDVHGAADDAAYKEQAEKAEGFRKEHAQRSCFRDFDPKLRVVDACFGIGKFPCVRNVDEEKPEAEDVKHLLHGINDSGNLYVLFGSTKDRAAAESRCKADPLVCKHEGDNYDIKLAETDCEPHTVMWKGYGTNHWKFLASLVLGCFVVFVCVIILDIFFYAPYVIYILSYSDVAGMSQGGMLSGLLLGMLITVCNQIIYMVIGTVADRCGWTNMDSKDCFYCVKYTLAVFFNTCLDLGTVLILAQGYSVDMAMKTQIANDSTMSPKAIAESPNMQKALYVQLVAYIFPSCTLLPFLIEPLGTAVLPFAVGKALVRSRREVTVQDAELCLQNPPYDLSRYGDILVNMMLTCMTMVFTYCDLWKLYLFMIISVIVIYAWDQLRVLRYTTKTVYATNTMDNAIMYMMAMPCGVLAMCLVFKAYGASHHGFLEDLRKNMEGEIGVAPNRFDIFLYLLAAFFGHCLLHWILLKYVVWPISDKEPVEEDNDADQTYAQLGAERPANYLNTNPVNCLRSKYVYRQDPPCIFYRVGKEHLIKKNEEIGIYFSGKVHVEDEAAFGSSLSETSNLKAKAMDQANHLKAGFMKFSDGV
jgi:hypothetical protein